MTIQLAQLRIDQPVMLAPMAGITDLPFRNLVQRFGAGLVVSEMVASQDVVQSRTGARDRAELGVLVKNSAVQLAGRQAYWMAEAAKLVAGQGARVIDINMGCPARKVTGGQSGSALMKNLDHAVGLLNAVVWAVDIPVTLKMRLGWDDQSHNAAELAQRAEGVGVSMITIHGRTRCQFYKGQADWAAIGTVKKSVGIPVVANGDIVDLESAKVALARSGADGIMVGRGVRGRPWLLANLAAQIYGGQAVFVPRGSDFINMVATHYCDAKSFYGRKLARNVMRKHLGWYMDYCGTPADLRKHILTERNTDQVMALIPDAMIVRHMAAA